jgi:uncharacterized protein
MAVLRVGSDFGPVAIVPSNIMFQSRSNPRLFHQLPGLLWPRSGWKRTSLYVWHRLRQISASPHTIALGFATGIFMSFNPMLGFHLIMAAIICWVIGGSFLAAAIGSLIGNPIMSPFMMLGNYHMGMLLIGEHIRHEFVNDGPKLTSAFFFANLGLAVAVPAYFAARAAAVAHQRRRRSRLCAKAALNLGG